ncbi:thioesterase family protein [Ancylobacter sp. 6x-1]|uniref:Thioesterase family protein n=1 Tax=Ancylobacter crimeensis TaxID=2579147 RepID=A0ABT0DE58_9HYPH|nr:thioesterase family protein [Ancylobacter crimeensis]MCK0198255.1 thioesterase family protein [Ancylobacter crimeensis]
MLDGIDFEPVFFAPFVSSAMTVEPHWVDHNGVLNAAYQGQLFDRAVDEAVFLVGLTNKAAEQRSAGFQPTETHQRFLRELRTGHQVRITVRLINYDELRVHLFQEMHHAREGWTASTREQMALHVDGASRRPVPFPDDVLERLAQMRAVHSTLPVPEGLGNKVDLPLHLS